MDEPARFGRYEIERPLGQGGMGVVYLARDPQLGRQLAIKVLAEEVASDPVRKARFLREARAAAALNHPNIATVYDFGEVEEDGRSSLFLALEYVEGEDLSARLSHSQPTLIEALEIARQIASGLEAAHRAGIVHRDLKPQNVRLTAEGLVKILDFGLAKLMAGEPTAVAGEFATQIGTAMGTVPYVAPEQARGEGSDERSDLFSLGVILFEMIEGRKPYRARRFVDFIIELERRGTPPLETVEEDLFDSVSDLVRRLLALDPEARAASSTQVVAELSALLHVSRDRAPTQAPTLLSSEARAKSPRPKWLVPSLVLAALLAVALVVGLSLRIAPGQLSIVVLPFDNRTGDPGLEYVASGLGLDLTSRLAAIDELTVLGHSVAAVYEQRSDGLERLVERYRVGRFVGGQLLRRQQDLQVAVELLDDRQRVLWTGVVTGSEEDLVSLQGELLGALGEQLASVLSQDSRARLERPPARSREAYRSLLRGLRALESGDDSDLEVAVAALEQAVVSDPELAPAHAALSKAFHKRYDSTGEASWLVSSLESGQAAARIDPELFEARLALAVAYREAGRFDQAESELEVARRLLGSTTGLPVAQLDGVAPEVRARLLGDLFEDEIDVLLEQAVTERGAGELDAAEATLRQVTERVPEDWRGWHGLGVLLMSQRRLDEAREQFELAQSLAGDETRSQENLILIHILEGNPAAASAAYEQFEGPISDPILLSNIGVAHYQIGDFVTAERYFRLAVQLRPGNGTLWGNLGDASNRLGRASAALEQYGVALEIIEQRLGLFPDRLEDQAARAMFLAKSERCPEAVASIEDLEQGAMAGRDLTRLGKALALCDRPGEALDALERAIGAGVDPRSLGGEDELRTLEREPRFQSWLAGAIPPA